jgi:hypothetical protein
LVSWDLLSDGPPVGSLNSDSYPTLGIASQGLDGGRLTYC